MAKVHIDDADWFFFTKEERSNVQSLIDAGMYGELHSAVSFGNSLTAHGKELVLQKIIDQMTPLFSDFTSEVRKELDAFTVKNGQIKDPVVEEEWNKRLKEEAEAHIVAQEEKKARKAEALAKREAKLKELRVKALDQSEEGPKEKTKK